MHLCIYISSLAHRHATHRATLVYPYNCMLLVTYYVLLPCIHTSIHLYICTSILLYIYTSICEAQEQKPMVKSFSGHSWGLPNCVQRNSLPWVFVQKPAASSQQPAASKQQQTAAGGSSQEAAGSSQQQPAAATSSNSSNSSQLVKIRLRS